MFKGTVVLGKIIKLLSGKTGIVFGSFIIYQIYINNIKIIKNKNMIIWLASYPKNGNTWLRSLISAYYYTKDGIFLGDNHLKNVQQFPVKKYLESFDYDLSIPGDTSRLWVLAQEKINEDRKIKFFKTHNALVKLGNNDFTNRANSLGGIYIVRDPRNVLDSMSRHFQIDHDKALEVMQDEKKLYLRL